MEYQMQKSRNKVCEKIIVISYTVLIVICTFANIPLSDGSDEIAHGRGNQSSLENITLFIDDDYEDFQADLSRSNGIQAYTSTESSKKYDLNPLIPDEDPLSYYFENEIFDTDISSSSEGYKSVSSGTDFSPYTGEYHPVSSGFVIGIFDSEIDMLVQFVQNEVGTLASVYYGNIDINYLQQCVASTVVNRILSPRFSETDVYHTLMSPGFFNGDISILSKKDAKDPITRENVMAVLTGKVVLDKDLIFEMAWGIVDENGNIVYDLDKIQKRMEKDCGKIEILYSAVYKRNNSTVVIAKKIW